MRHLLITPGMPPHGQASRVHGFGEGQVKMLSDECESGGGEGETRKNHQIRLLMTYRR